MPLITPITDWSQGGSINEVTMERIEGNIAKVAGMGKVYTATGTGAAIVITTDGYFAKTSGMPVKFVASANNSGSATTANVDATGAVPVYKPGTTTAPTLIANKAYELWYNTTSACFFFKASAEGTVPANYVLTGYTFSNDNDTGVAGTMVNNGGVVITPGATAQTIPLGWHNGSGIVANLGGTATAAYVHPSYTFSSNAAGRAVAGAMSTKSVATITPSTVRQSIAANQYLTGDQTIDSLGGNAPTAAVRPGYTFSSDAVGRAVAGTMAEYISVNQAGTQQGVGSEGIIYIMPPTGYWYNANTYIQDADFVASNIKSGVSMLGLTGTLMSGSTFSSETLGVEFYQAYQGYQQSYSGVFRDYGSNCKAIIICPTSCGLPTGSGGTSPGIYSSVRASIGGGDNLNSSDSHLSLAGSGGGSVDICAYGDSSQYNLTDYSTGAAAFRVGSSDTWYVITTRGHYNSEDTGYISTTSVVTLTGNIQLKYNVHLVTYSGSPYADVFVNANVYFITG